MVRLKHIFGAAKAAAPSSRPPAAPPVPAALTQPAAPAAPLSLLGRLMQWKMPLLVLSYILIYLLIDLTVDNLIRYYIFCIFLVVSSLYFSWYLGGKETMLYVTFFNIFFAFIFSRLLYLTGGETFYRQIFLGRSFLVLYIISIVFMAIMIRRKSPADLEKERREEYIQEERNKRLQLELMVATEKLTHDLITQANLVKDELLLLNGAWKSEIHSIINDLPTVKERELYNQIVAPFQESIISHLRDLESRLSFSPKPEPLETVRALLAGKLFSDKIHKDNRIRLDVDDTGWRENPTCVVLDVNKLWEIVLNLVRNSQTAMELKQIRLLKTDKQAFAHYKPRLAVQCEAAGDRACIRIMDNGGGLDDAVLGDLFKNPLPSSKRGGKSYGQGTIFVKFFGESMGIELGARNTDALGEKGLEVTLTVPVLKTVPQDAAPGASTAPPHAAPADAAQGE
ncbi:MAG: ATP-binding protein [Desulfovibrionaceae bacterium]